jgi:dihydrofolate reductase
MARLVYSAICSLDGYTEDADGSGGSGGSDGSDPPEVVDYASIWQAADKIVYSSSLDRVSTARTTIERAFEADAVRRLKETAAADLSIGGPALASEALGLGLVDELHLYLSPVVVGGGKPALPPGLRLDLDLLGEHRFTAGVVHQHYAVRSATS